MWIYLTNVNLFNKCIYIVSIFGLIFNIYNVSHKRWVFCLKYGVLTVSSYDVWYVIYVR